MAKKNKKDPLGLTELFQGGGEEWLSLLKDTIEAQIDAEDFVGPDRGPGVVPVRELMFQALKPNPPEKWNVVVFGQNPYPRVESATGIAMFDNTFNEWKDSKFGRVVSMRCIIKAACIWKYEIDPKTRVGDIRKLLSQKDIVPPPEWFQAILTQGVLLLNAALTASGDGAMSTSQHTSFWRPVVEKIVEEILRAKQGAAEENKGVVFLWWGSHAKSLKSMVQRLEKKYKSVPVKHIEHCNPAAQGDMFCKGNHFSDVNKKLASLNMNEIDWLPAKGWNESADASLADADQMGDFIAKTMELHKVYLERLQSVKDEGKKELSPITGVFDSPVLEFSEALKPVVKLFKSLQATIKRSKAFGEKLVSLKRSGALSADEVATLYLYTCESVFYRKLNASLRMSQRSKVKPYIPYLKLLFSALDKMACYHKSLWRGVALDLKKHYPKGKVITWWGVSSCTAKLSVAKGFLGYSGRRTLFEIEPASAVGIKCFSAFTGEDEYLLAPGTQLEVVSVKTEKSGLCTIRLKELKGQGQVS